MDIWKINRLLTRVISIFLLKYVEGHCCPERDAPMLSLLQPPNYFSCFVGI